MDRPRWIAASDYRMNCRRRRIYYSGFYQCGVDCYRSTRRTCACRPSSGQNRSHPSHNSRRHSCNVAVTASPGYHVTRRHSSSTIPCPGHTTGRYSNRHCTTPGYYDQRDVSCCSWLGNSVRTWYNHPVHNGYLCCPQSQSSHTDVCHDYHGDDKTFRKDWYGPDTIVRLPDADEYVRNVSLPGKSHHYEGRHAVVCTQSPDFQTTFSI